MRVLLKKDFTIDLLSVDKVINVNDSMVSRLEVEVEENFLLPGERLWVVFSKTKDTPTDDITKEIQLGTDNKTYSVAIPQGVVMQEGTWFFILSARKYYSESKYFTRKATAPYEFTVEGGLWIDEATGEVVNNATAQSLYEMATEKLEREQNNYEQIVVLQEDVSKAKTDILAEITDRQAMDTAISQAAQEARSRAEEAVASALNANVQIANVADKLYEEISSTDSEIRQIQIDLTTVKGIEEDFRNLDGKVAYGKASSISVSVDPLTYVATFTLHADGGVPISTAEIDLPTEELVIDGYYNEAFGNIVLTLRNGKKIEVSVRDLVDGLISTSQKGAPNGVATLNENGKVPVEQLPDDIGGGIDDEALKEYVKFTDYANAEKAGVVKISDWYGIGCYKEGMSAGIQYVISATNAEINGKTQRYKPIVPYNQDHAWKVSATTNTETWTDEDKAAACETIGAAPKITTPNRLYSVNSQNETVPLVYATGAQANTVAFRGSSGTLSVGTPTEGSHATPRTYVDDNKGTKLYKHVIYHEEDGGYPTNETIAISLSNTPYTSQSQIATDYLNGTILTLITSGHKVCGMSGTSAFFVADTGFSELNFFLVPIVNDTITAL